MKAHVAQGDDDITPCSVAQLPLEFSRRHHKVRVVHLHGGNTWGSAPHTTTVTTLTRAAYIAAWHFSQRGEPSFLHQPHEAEPHTVSLHYPNHGATGERKAGVHVERIGDKPRAPNLFRQLLKRLNAEVEVVVLPRHQVHLGEAMLACPFQQAGSPNGSRRTP